MKGTSMGRTLLLVALLLLAVVFLTGVSAGDEVNFEVDIATDEAVDRGDNLTVDVTVENTGTSEATQTIYLNDSEDTYFDEKEVTLGAGESEELTLTWEEVPQERTIDPTVYSDDSVAAEVVTVRWSKFVVSDVDPETQTIEHNGTFTAEANVSNDGTIEDEQEIQLLLNESVRASENITLDGEADTTVTFEEVDPGEDPGDYTYRIASNDTEATGELTIEEPPEPEPEPDPAEFTVTILETTAEDGTAIIDAEFTNEGEAQETQPVTLLIDGTEVESRDLTLAGGESTTEQFTHDPPSFPINATLVTELPDAYSERIEGVNTEEGPAIDDVSPTLAEVGDSVDVTYTADGERVTDVAVTVYNPSGDVVGQQDVPSGVDETVTFGAGDLVIDEPGWYDVALTVEDEFDRSATITEREAFESPVDLDMAIEDVTPTLVQADESFEVMYTAEGTNVANVKLIVYNPSGERIGQQGVPAGENQTVNFGVADLDINEPGWYDVELIVENEFGGNSSKTEERAFESPVDLDMAIEDAAPTLVQADESLEVEYTAQGTNVAEVTLSTVDAGGETQLTSTVEPGSDVTDTLDREELDALDPGPYDLVLSIEDAFGDVHTVTEADAFQIGRVHDPDVANFGAVTFEGVAGDFVTVDVSLDGDDVDEAFILVGSDEPAEEPSIPSGPIDVLHVSGDTTFVVNTRLLGTDRPSWSVYTPIEGSVTSYAHSLGPDSDPEPGSVFEDLRFENEDGERIADTLAEFRAQAGVGGQLRPLAPGRFGLVVGEAESIIVRDDGVADPRYVYDRANIELTEPEVGDVTTYVLPEGNADQLQYEPDPDDLEDIDAGDLPAILDLAEESDSLTIGDRLLIQLEMSGIWGAAIDTLTDPEVIDAEETGLITPQEFEALFELPEGLSLDAIQRNHEPNQVATTLDLFDADVSDVSVFVAPFVSDEPLDGVGSMFVLVDTRDPAPVSAPLEDGDEFEIQFAVEKDPDEEYVFDVVARDEKPGPYAPAGGPQYPYFEPDGETVERSQTVEFIERTFEYNRTDADGRPVVTNSSDETITGTTTYPETAAPVDMVIDLRHEPRSVEIEDIDIDGETGTFEAQVDLSDIDAEDEVDIELWALEERLDKRPLTIFSEEAEFSLFEIRDLTTQTPVVDGEALVDLSAQVANLGSLGANETVELLVDGEVVDEQQVEIDRGDTRAVRFDEEATALDPGTYPIEIRTPDDSLNELLIVPDTEANFTVESFDVETVDDGQTGTATATIRNAGLSTDTAEIFFSIDGETARNETVEMPPRTSVTIEFDRQLTNLDPGEYDLLVETQNDSATEALELEAEPTTTVSITDLRVESPIEPDGELNVTVDLANNETIPAEDSVDLFVDTQFIDQQAVELDPESDETFTFESDLQRQPGEYTVIVETADDDAQVPLVVADEDDVPDEEEPDEADEDEGLFGLGVTGRTAVGGTLIVGAVYVLGHWV